MKGVSLKAAQTLQGRKLRAVVSACRPPAHESRICAGHWLRLRALALFLRDKGIPLPWLTLASQIECARTICPEFGFLVADVFNTDPCTANDYDTVVSTEFLEHIEHDLDVIEKIRPGTLRHRAEFRSFHVRHFTSTQEVYDRYEVPPASMSF